MSKSRVNKPLDKDLFEQLFRTHFVQLCNYAVQYVSDNEIAKDITQNVFINLWEKRDNIDSQKSIQSYLFTSVRNRCFNYIRDNTKYRSKVLDIDSVDIENDVEIDDVGMEELEEKISLILNKLPEKCRKVFEMSRFKNMKYKEIAIEMEISVKTVEAHISKALKSLRKELKGYALVLFILFEILNGNT